MKFGNFIRELRLSKEITLRQFCIQTKSDPGNYSKIERGILPPPKSQDTLNGYAKVLGLEQGEDNWFKLFDLAATDKGIIPEDLRKNKDANKLFPVFFRTLRGQKPTKAEMEALLNKLKEAEK